MPEIIKQFDLKVGAEIGVAFGTHSEYMLMHTDLVKLYSVDPYKNFTGSPAELAGLGSMNMAQKFMDVLHYRVGLRLASYGTRSELVRMTSTSAAQKIPDGALDFVYIDGDHSYTAVSDDIEAWWPKVRAGGIVAGDDYAQPNHPGVTRAVDEFMQKRGLTINRSQPHAWWVQKPMAKRSGNAPEPKHLVSFIIPCFNRASVLRETIDSIYRQEELEHFEVVCVDDCSTDKTVQLLEEYADKYSNFHFYVHAINGGASEARNTAISHAHGDLLFTLDSDNVLAANSVHKLVELLDESGCDIAAFQEIRYFNVKKGHVKSHWCVPKGAKNTILAIWNIFPNHYIVLGSGNYLFTRESWLAANKYEGRALETFTFGFRQLATGSKIAILPDSFYWHRAGDDSKWVKNEKNGTNRIAAFKAVSDCQEIFTPEANIRIANYDIGKYKPLEHLNAGYFKLLPQEALELLFKAYREERHGNFAAAVVYYQEAIGMGCTHPKTRERLANVLEELEDPRTRSLKDHRRSELSRLAFRMLK